MDEEHPLTRKLPYAATKAGPRSAATYGLDRHRPAVQQLRAAPHPEKVIRASSFSRRWPVSRWCTATGRRAATDYVEDDAEAIQWVIEADLDAVAGEVINVATGQGRFGVGEIADLVLELCGKPVTLKEHVEERPARWRATLDGEGQAAARLGCSDIA